MRTTIWAVSAVLLACGGTSRDRTTIESDPNLPEPGRPYEADEVWPAGDGPSAGEEVQIVAPFEVIHWKGETISFYDTTGPGEAPSVLYTTLGRVAEGEVGFFLQQQAEFTLTPAELWLAVTGRDDVPDLLLDAHVELAMSSGRPLDLQKLDVTLIEVDKATFSFNSMFPNPGTTPQGCWDKSLVFEHVCLAQPSQCGNNFNGGPVPAKSPEVSVCSAADPAANPLGVFRSVQAGTACNSSLGTTKPTRIGIFNELNVNQIFPAKICFAPTSSTWSCDPEVAIPGASYYTATNPGTATNHRNAIGASSSGNLRYISVGAAVYKAPGVPQFGLTKC